MDSVLKTGRAAFTYKSSGLKSVVEPRPAIPSREHQTGDREKREYTIKTRTYLTRHEGVCFLHTFCSKVDRDSKGG
jgi:hypothetical protein